MKNKSLIDIVKDDVFKFLAFEIHEILFNERDFQMHLALYLRSTGKYDDVDLEYYVPRDELNHYPWDSEIRLDVVVMKDGEYLPIELKYKTKKVERIINRFSEQLKNKCVVLKNQGAQDLGMYDFWKDVCRVELVRERFPAVKHGLAVFMTNDTFYLKASSPHANYSNFCMSEGTHSATKTWLNKEAAITKSRPEFILQKDYVVHWDSVEIDQIQFHYCVVEI